MGSSKKTQELSWMTSCLTLKARSSPTGGPLNSLQYTQGPPLPLKLSLKGTHMVTDDLTHLLDEISSCSLVGRLTCLCFYAAFPSGGFTETSDPC